MVLGSGYLGSSPGSTTKQPVGWPWGKSSISFLSRKMGVGLNWSNVVFFSPHFSHLYLRFQLLQTTWPSVLKKQLIQVWLLGWWGCSGHQPKRGAGLPQWSPLNPTFLLPANLVSSALDLSTGSPACFVISYFIHFSDIHPRPQAQSCLVPIPDLGGEEASSRKAFLAALLTGTRASFALCEQAVCL